MFWKAVLHPPYLPPNLHISSLLLPLPLSNLLPQFLLNRLPRTSLTSECLSPGPWVPPGPSLANLGPGLLPTQQLPRQIAFDSRIVAPLMRAQYDKTRYRSGSWALNCFRWSPVWFCPLVRYHSLLQFQALSENQCRLGTICSSPYRQVCANFSSLHISQSVISIPAGFAPLKCPQATLQVM